MRGGRGKKKHPLTIQTLLHRKKGKEGGEKGGGKRFFYRGKKKRGASSHPLVSIFPGDDEGEGGKKEEGSRLRADVYKQLGGGKRGVKKEQKMW